MTWDGVCPECDEFFNEPKKMIISSGTEVCRHCRRMVEPGIRIEIYEFPQSFRNTMNPAEDLYYHLGQGKNCPSGKNEPQITA
jgi:hypothetical protein